MTKGIHNQQRQPRAKQVRQPAPASAAPAAESAPAADGEVIHPDDSTVEVLTDAEAPADAEALTDLKVEPSPSEDQPSASIGDEITVRVLKHHEQRGVTIPNGTELTLKNTREVQRQIRHGSLELVTK